MTTVFLMPPHAKIVHVMRDPMDSCFSCYSRLFESSHLDFAYDLGTVVPLLHALHRVDAALASRTANGHDAGRAEQRIFIFP